MLAVFACCCALVTGYALWSSYRFAEKQREKIYVLDGGKSLMMALSQDLSQNRPAEARGGYRRFHELFFGALTPEGCQSAQGINRALQTGRQECLSLLCGFCRKRVLQPPDFRQHLTRWCMWTAWCATLPPARTRRRTYARQLIIRESNVTELQPRNFLLASKHRAFGRQSQRIHYRAVYRAGE